MTKIWIDKLPQNQALRVVDIFFTIFKVLLVIGGFFLSLAMFSGLFSPDILDFTHSNLGGSHYFEITPYFQTQGYENMVHSPGFTFRNISFFTRTDSFLRVSALICLNFMLLHRFQSFIRNSCRFNSHFKDSAPIFKSMVLYSLWIIIIQILPSVVIIHGTIVDGIRNNSESSVYFNFPLAYLLLMLVCLAFYEVFKEGEELKQEAEYTV